MSPADISRIASIGAPRSVGRDGPAETRERPAQPAAPTSQSAVKVEADTTIDTSRPPVDATRVAAIRKALEQGTYPLAPARIADAIIAAPLLLNAAK
ncbi:MAG: flagellar biosynthesis anti-sigma factor FlgM [Pontixanthobacter sp.]